MRSFPWEKILQKIPSEIQNSFRKTPFQFTLGIKSGNKSILLAWSRWQQFKKKLEQLIKQWFWGEFGLELLQTAFFRILRRCPHISA